MLSINPSSLTEHSDVVRTAADRLVSEGLEEEEEDVCACLSNREAGGRRYAYKMGTNFGISRIRMREKERKAATFPLAAVSAETM